MRLKEKMAKDAEHHRSMARIAKVESDGHGALAEATSGAESAAHVVISQAAMERSKAHERAAEDCDECAKGMEAEELEKSVELQPWPARATIPSDVPLRKVLRPGQPDYSEGGAQIAEPFRKLVEDFGGEI